MSHVHKQHRSAFSVAVAALVLVLSLALASSAMAGSRHHHHHAYHPRPYVPPGGHVFHGVSETTAGVSDVRHFARQVDAHPAVVEDFYHWGTPLSTGALKRWHQERARGVLSLSTAPGGQPEVITPHQIAQGRGDHYLVRDNQSIAESHQVVYIRLFPEMNGYWNPYSAFNSDGTPRDGHSTKQFVNAWRRAVIIVRGGPVKTINHKLVRLGMPRLLRAKSNSARIYRHNNIHGRLAHPKVAFIWNPQSVSNPAINANASSKYWPGARYVDWVGGDIYSKFASPGVKSGLAKLQHHYRHFPFVVGEYGPWDNDVSGAFTQWLMHWVVHTKAVRMAIYYRSTAPNSVFDIANFALARTRLHRALNSHRFLQYAPELRPRH